ncbi:MAG TPA: hypothetical protein VFX41_01300 [Actinomycetales bacterium]|nr:hypothetical protein [Actinomycetales bacterium]
MPWLEIIGWVGSAVLVWSLAQARVLRFRVLNFIASVVLTGYNAVIGVWPMVAVNAVIAVIDAYHLVRLLRDRDDELAYEVVEVGPTEDYLRHILRRYGPDIERHNPGFVWDGAVSGSSAFLVLRDSETVGMVLISQRPDEPGVGHVELDYVTPRFRDFSVGKFVYRQGGLLTSQGFRRLVAPTERMVDARDYFPRVGFTTRSGGELVLDVAERARA